MGGADSEVSIATTRIVFEAAWFKPASVRATSKQAGTARPKRRCASSAASTSRRPPRDGARVRVARADRRRHRRRHHSPTCIRAVHQPTTLFLERAAHRRPARHGRAGRRGRAHPDVAGLPRERRRRAGWDVHRSGMARRHASPGRSDRGGRASLRLRASAVTFPGVEQAPPPSDPRIARDRACARALLGMGFSEAITLRASSKRGRRAVPGRRRAGGARQSAVGEVRRDAAEPVARPDRRASATTAAMAVPTFGSSRSARASRRAAKRGRGVGVDGPRHARSLERQPARRRLLRPQGRRRTTRRRCSASAWCRDTSTRDRSGAVPRARARRRDLVNGDSVVGVLGQLRRRSATRAICRRQRCRTSRKSISTLSRPRRRSRPRDSRRHCRAIPFVGRETSSILVDEYLVCGNGSWHHSIGRARHAGAGSRVRSLPGQGHSGRQGQPVVPPDVPVARAHAHRRRGASGHARRIVELLASELGATRR